MSLLTVYFRLNNFFLFFILGSLFYFLNKKLFSCRKPVLVLLGALGVSEAEQWLWPELESWDSEPQDQTNIWVKLHDRAECWTESWISKFKVNISGSLLIMSNEYLLSLTVFVALAKYLNH